MSVVHYISQPYRPQTPGPALWLYALRSALVQTPLPDTNGKRVDLAPWPKQICKKGIVQFVDNGRPEFERMKIETIRPDMIVLASGYSHSFPFFNSTDKTGSIPYPTPDKADVRQVWKRDDPTVGFIGFLRPNLGAIPPLSEMQAQLWVTNLLAPAKIPRALVAEDESHYRLIYTPTTRIKYGIDHESYIYQLGLDMNSAPGLTDIMGLMSWRNPYKSWKLLLFWAIGANLNTKFRLRGPWKWDGAADMMTSDEFWQTITRRPILFGKLPCCPATAPKLTARRTYLCIACAHVDFWPNQPRMFPVYGIIGLSECCLSTCRWKEQRSKAIKEMTKPAHITKIDVYECNIKRLRATVLECNNIYSIN